MNDLLYDNYEDEEPWWCQCRAMHGDEEFDADKCASCGKPIDDEPFSPPTVGNEVI